MRKKNVYNSIIGGILAAVMLLSFAGCGNSNLPVDSTDDISISTNSSEAESSSENVENVGYEFPAGAESEYALYTAVVDYLNNGLPKRYLVSSNSFCAVSAMQSLLEIRVSSVFSLSST